MSKRAVKILIALAIATVVAILQMQQLTKNMALVVLEATILIMWIKEIADNRMNDY